jgi:hypothetical protein
MRIWIFLILVFRANLKFASFGYRLYLAIRDLNCRVKPTSESVVILSSFSCWWSPLRSGNHQQEKVENSTEKYFEDN